MVHGGGGPRQHGRLKWLDNKGGDLTSLLPLQELLEEVHRQVPVLGQVGASINSQEREHLTLRPELGGEVVDVDELGVWDLRLFWFHCRD